MIFFIDDSGGGGEGGATYRYWRIYVTAVNSGAYLAIQEIELRATSGGADLTNPSTPANESSFFLADTARAYKAVDNGTNPATQCFVTDGGAMPQWGYWDLLTPTVVAELAVWPQNNADATVRGPRDFLVQGSNDASSWTTVKSYSGVTGWTAGVAKTFDLT